MSNGLITDQAEFDELCAHIRESGIVAFDTEFISESTYRPQLCLVQLATRDRCVAVDPFKLDLAEWWQIMLDDEITIVTHAAREEARFCMTNTGELPRNIVDVQLAEGLRSTSYPLSYERLIGRVMGKSLNATETRTDWQRRPLTDRQIEYALDDVRYLLDVWDRQRKSLENRNRLGWATEEFERLLVDMKAERSGENWVRLSGVKRLNPKQLAVARELYGWREEEADRRDSPIRRVLRDDLLIDLAKRQPQSETELLNSRDMNRSNFRRAAAGIVECVQRALALPKSEHPPKFTREKSGNEDPVIGKLLALSLANRCAEQNLSAGLVGTSSDLREFVNWHNTGRNGTRPRLATGWRGEICGDLLSDVLDGKVSVRVGDASSDHPLVFERTSE
ncbi:MAG: HRDC domain-containing protein [Planctomycetota bacterium]|nr:HRDC domain-containing protein [Planctomycetota bacterium]MDA1249321.1 HRDC domain-containing protein [Planctomycetota bacterium]